MIKILILVALFGAFALCGSSEVDNLSKDDSPPAVTEKKPSKVAEIWVMLVKVTIKVVHVLGCLSSKWTEKCSDQMVQCFGYLNTNQCASLGTCGARASLGCVTSMVNPFG